MADVDIQCLSCGNQITVSDVVNVEKLKCHACGGDFLRSNAPAPAAGPTQEEKRRSLMRKSAESIPTAAAPQQGKAQQPAEPEVNRLAWDKLNNPEAQAEVQKQSQKMYSALTWKAWVCFIVTAAIAGTLRYSGLVPAGILEKAVFYEAILVAAFHVIIVLKAFQDSVFQGILCILLPPYAIYYLFSASDDFYLRAFIAGLLVGVGQDAAVVFHEWSVVGIDAVNKWISSGG